MRSISALVMHFKRVRGLKYLVSIVLPLIITCLSCTSPEAEVINRVVAFIDDQAITLKDFNEYYKLAKRFHKDLTPEKALETLINRLIILREANRLKLKGASDDDIIDTYIDIKIRAFVRVSEDEIARFYETNRAKLKDVPLKDVKHQIETLIKEKKINTQLKKHLEKLKKDSYIKINYIPEL